jgi:hypothetical protein
VAFGAGKYTLVREVSGLSPEELANRRSRLLGSAWPVTKVNGDPERGTGAVSMRSAVAYELSLRTDRLYKEEALPRLYEEHPMDGPDLLGPVERILAADRQWEGIWSWHQIWRSLHMAGHGSTGVIAGTELNGEPSFRHVRLVDARVPHTRTVVREIVVLDPGRGKIGKLEDLRDVKFLLTPVGKPQSLDEVAINPPPTYDKPGVTVLPNGAVLDAPEAPPPYGKPPRRHTR